MFDVIRPTASTELRSRLLSAAAHLTACADRQALAATAAEAIGGLLASTIVAVRVAGRSVWSIAPGAADLAAHLVRELASADLDAALHGGLVVDLGDPAGAWGALAAGIDAGPHADPGVVLVAGAGVDPELDGAVVVALAGLVASVLGQLDRTERWAEAAETDPVTGFANRVGLERAIDVASAEGVGIGLVDLHLGGVTELGASFGGGAVRCVVRALGERLLALPCVVAVASTSAEGLTAVVRGDESAAADQVAAAASRPVLLGRQAVCIDVHAGAAARPMETPARVVIDRAALARVQAVAAGRAVVVHSEALAAGCHARLETAAQLRRVLDAGGDELVVHYQPQVDADGRVLGLEALVRWVRPDGTTVRPDDFLPVAERAALTAEIDLHVLRASCRQLARWSAAGLDGFRVAVNLSASTVARAGIAGAVVAVLEETGVDPTRLELEITESAATDETGWVATLEQLRSLGVAVAMDDFGTGYSSLGRIHRLPLDRLKIDRSFVADLDGAGSSVVAAVVSLARGFGLRVLAEGVEDEGQLAALVGLGCDEFQGYAFGRPVPAAEATAVLLLAGIGSAHR